jgi:hypothetical protein
MDIMEIARRCNLIVIEDNAELRRHVSRTWDHRHGVFQPQLLRWFRGEAGLVLTDDEYLYTRAKPA